MSMSRQEQRAAEAEAQQMAHARQAAREITHERTESARVVGGGGPQRVEVHRGGILEAARSLVSAVSRTLGVGVAVASRDDATAESPLAESKDTATAARSPDE